MTADTHAAARWLIGLLPTRWYTRRCHGCSDPSPHDSHLTWLGRKRYAP